MKFVHTSGDKLLERLPHKPLKRNHNFTFTRCDADSRSSHTCANALTDFLLLYRRQHFAHSAVCLVFLDVFS